MFSNLNVNVTKCVTKMSQKYRQDTPLVKSRGVRSTTHPQDRSLTCMTSLAELGYHYDAIMGRKTLLTHSLLGLGFLTGN